MSFDNSPSTAQLSGIQKADLDRIWPNHSPEPDDACSATQNEILDGTTYQHVARLHSFLIHTATEAAERGGAEDDPAHKKVVEDILSVIFFGTSKRKGTNNLVPARLRLTERRHVVFLPYKCFHDALRDFEEKHRRNLQQPSYASFLYHFPDKALAALGSAMALSMATLWRKKYISNLNNHIEQQQLLMKALEQCTFVVRFLDADRISSIGDIKTSLNEKLVSVKAYVIKAKPKRLRVTRADFRCNRCGEQFAFQLMNGKYNIPTRCIASSCRSKTFALLRSTAKYVGFQELKLQELPDDKVAASTSSSSDAGRSPRQIEVEVTDDLVDTCATGDIVKVVGIVKSISTALAAGRTGRQALETSTYKLYIKANSITNTTSSESDRANNKKRKNSSAKKISFSASQLEDIRKIAHADHRIGSMKMRQSFPFDLLVHSLCPSIVGHELVKAGLLLILLGGTSPPTSGLDAHNCSTIRSNSHILIVGDPGMGKSCMLLAISQIPSRSVYVGGNTSSTTGLTCSLSKEGGEVAIEAGALILADQGVCCIDEFDKMAKANQDGLLEAMEQQQISIAKAGVVASLPARCSIVAAANPKHGSYDLGKSVAENLNISPPLLSRFDLVFILRDKASLRLDNLVSSSIIDLYRDRPVGFGGSQPKIAASVSLDDKQPHNLEERLRWVGSFQKVALPVSVLRDYIAYAREYCKPKLTRKAANILHQYFMQLRHGERGSDSVPITTRQLEALIRLSQARAKAALRDFVLEEDAEDVVELMIESVNQVHRDENGIIDRTRGGAGGKSKRKQKLAFINGVKHYIEANNTINLTLSDLRRVADIAKTDLSGFPSFIEELREQGELIKNSDGTFKLSSHASW